MRPAVSLSTIPPELTTYPQWVCWRYGPERNGRREKIPYNPPTGHLASVSNSGTWATFEEAARVVEQYDGLGFVLTSADPFVGVDLDHCRDPATGAIEKWARDTIVSLCSYTELTPSGTGFRIFVRATLPPQGRKHGPVELYDDRRFLTLTGSLLPGAPTTIEHRQEEMRVLHGHYFPSTKPRTTTNDHHRPVTVATPVASLTAEDRALHIKACTAKDGLRFADLWNGNRNDYPSPSEADLALCSMLAYHCNGDAARVDRLFRKSGLFRPKWDEQRGVQTYGERTIARALQQLQGGSVGQVPTKDQAHRRARLICLADVAPQPVSWLWPERIPRGKLTLLIGDPGMGKSTLLLDLIARITIEVDAGRTASKPRSVACLSSPPRMGSRTRSARAWTG
jgi:primase-polymerase (primpol)-like protein